MSGPQQQQQQHPASWAPDIMTTAGQPSHQVPATGLGIHLPPLTRPFGQQDSERQDMAKARTPMYDPVRSTEPDSPRPRKFPAVQVPASLPPMNLQQERKPSTGLPPHSLSPASIGADGRSQRVILAPRSPMQRAASLSGPYPQNPSGPRQLPFPTSPGSRSAIVEPTGSFLNSMPAPAISRHFHPTSDLNMQTSRLASPVQRQSRSISPSGSFSSYGQDGKVSPGGGYHYTNDNPNPMSTPGGNNAMQMMTIQTTSGSMQFPVNVQAASRVADEKRKRNAGASARFRERRKKKEMEASATIRKLEQQVKDLAEDADHYRRERDYLAKAMLQTPGGESHFPRPQSPRLRRSANRSMSRSYSPNGGPEPWNPEGQRNVRRRTSSFESSHNPHRRPENAPQTQSYPPNQPKINEPPGSQPTQCPSFHHQLPPFNTLPAPPPVMPTGPAIGPQDPFAQQRHERGQPLVPFMAQHMSR